MRSAQALKLKRIPVIFQCCEGAARNCPLRPADEQVPEAGKHRRISGSVFHAPAANDVVERPKNSRKKCQQKCQQISTRVAQGQNLTVPPAPLVNTSISVPTGRGEGRRFRPSPPALTASAAES